MQYKLSGYKRPRTSTAKHYLRKWHELDKNIHELDEAQEITMRILYAALKQLNSEDAQFLYEKYNRPGGRLSDLSMAEMEGVTLPQYQNRRIDIETQLAKIIDEVKPEYEREL